MRFGAQAGWAKCYFLRVVGFVQPLFAFHSAAERGRHAYELERGVFNGRRRVHFACFVVYRSSVKRLHGVNSHLINGERGVND